MRQWELFTRIREGPGTPFIHADRRGELEVIEYKLTDETNDELDRTQVALYRELLRRAHDLEARAVLLLRPGAAAQPSARRAAR
jgi:hypothetical protein